MRRGSKESPSAGTYRARGCGRALRLCRRSGTRQTGSFQSTNGDWTAGTSAPPTCTATTSAPHHRDGRHILRLAVTHHHHHQVRVAGDGRRVVAPPCPRSTARLQRSPIGRVESFRSWSAGRLSDTLTWS